MVELRLLMRRIVECVPNFSEGRRKHVIDAIVARAKETPGVKVLDVLYDGYYNRMVLTFAGEPEAVRAAAMATAEEAIKHINMEEHKGQHPRIGAVDVVPFVPVKGVSMEEVVELARGFARELAEKFDLPVYLYGEAALRPERRDLDYIRRGEYEGLKREIHLPERRPDFGPARMHPTAGASIVGARGFMAGFNVNLGTSDIKVARKIARALHAKKGGLAFVKAMGASIPEKGITQVGMSVYMPEKTPLYRVFELLKIEASRYNVPVLSSEVVGVWPVQVLIDVVRYYLKVENLDRSKVLEVALYEG